MERILKYKVDLYNNKNIELGCVSKNDTVYLSIDIENISNDTNSIKLSILGKRSDETLIEQKANEDMVKENKLYIKLKKEFVNVKGIVNLNIKLEDEEGSITEIEPYFYVNSTLEGEIVEEKDTIDTLKEIEEKVNNRLKELTPEKLKGEQGPQGLQGENGITPHIGDNGNWFLGDEDTGRPSRGKGGSGEIIVDYVHDSNEVIEISEIVYDTATFITKENHGLKNGDPVMLVYGKGFLEKFDIRVVPTELEQESTVFAVSNVTTNSFKIIRKIGSSLGTGFSRFTNSSYIDVSKFHFEKAPGLLELELVKKYKNISIEVFTVFSSPFEIKFEKFISSDRGYREKFDPLVNRVKGNIFTKVDIDSTKDITIIVAESNINMFNNSSDRYFSRNYYGHKSGFSTELKYIDKFTLDFGIQDSGGAYLPNGTRIKVRNLGGIENDRN
ncbi:hypothetical protein K5V21_06040 [Clostridium sardiniense]|uniref:BppU N-terminal domain-containing protein n=1 Tax=Clostridium sardiniense TaxID=29369 RepID=A0ABS7KWB7_CLOSR|nr:hypothetical protein [Clostridium sardiniense]MBY0755014.1 hypothetical protein [Clostridium sardiniense]MDQ0459132.1 prefoldin subunit 5 [Clostridium sardiniense]